MAYDCRLSSEMPRERKDCTAPPLSGGGESGWRRLAVLVSLAGLLAIGATVTGMQGNGASPMRPKGGGLAGQLLVATDALSDPRFAHSVIYMIQHDASGAMGLVVNRPIGDAPLAKLLEELGLNSQGISRDIRVHYGGPVEPGRGFTLHTSEYAREGTQVVGDGVALTVDPEILRDVGLGKGPRLALLAVGYAGWAPGQLEAEIKAGAWIAVPADEALLFDEDYPTKWERATARRMFQL
ncbi:MAG TPA: YqgE/AlgH family protein [Candidatus Methylomirabilis sp.]|nr:YqgE/AlgH family protein [Candidatus Methylomirabilis sp.]